MVVGSMPDTAREVGPRLGSSCRSLRATPGDRGDPGCPTSRRMVHRELSADACAPLREPADHPDMTELTPWPEGPPGSRFAATSRRTFLRRSALALGVAASGGLLAACGASDDAGV